MEVTASVPNKVFVGGIPKMTTDDELMRTAEMFGAVKFVKIIRGVSKSSATFGFVSFMDDISAQKMMASRVRLKGQVVDCKPTQRYDSLKAANEDIYRRKIYIGGFSRRLSENQIKDLLLQFGSIDQVVINKDLQSGLSRGSGFVIFKHERDCAYVSQLRVEELYGQRLIILPCKKRGQIFKRQTFTSNLQKNSSKLEKNTKEGSSYFVTKPRVGKTILQLI